MSSTCVLFKDGTSKCTGYNSFAFGDPDEPKTNVLVDTGFPVATQIESGANHFCALLKTGKVLCSGVNGSGQLGDGTGEDSIHPVEVKGLSDVVEIAIGGNTTCARHAAGNVSCWGDNSYGQVGDGSSANALSPKPVKSLANVKQVRLGSGHACAILSDQSVKCWGANWYGNVGDGTLKNQLSPVAVHGLSGVAELALGYTYSCARFADGSVKCWGDRTMGIVGDGGAMAGNQLTPGPAVSGLSQAKALAAGNYGHVCALLADQSVKCWGYGFQGRLGNGTDDNRNLPTAVANVGGAVQIVAGNDHSCAMLSERSVKCWGQNSNGQFGNGTYVDAPTAADMRL